MNPTNQHRVSSHARASIAAAKLNLTPTSLTKRKIQLCRARLLRHVTQDKPQPPGRMLTSLRHVLARFRTLLATALPKNTKQQGRNTDSKMKEIECEPDPRHPIYVFSPCPHCFVTSRKAGFDWPGGWCSRCPPF
jgi:hypothetical protein